MLKKEIIFVNNYNYNEIKEASQKLKNCEILLLENTRHMDLPNKLESGNDIEFSKFLSTLGDVFVMDAFGASHRSHASTKGISNYLPSCTGLLVERELFELDKIKEENKSIIIGGAKVSSKIGVIKNLIEKANYVCVGGAMCGTFLKAQNISVGKTFVDEEYIGDVKNLIDKYSSKIILPIDAVTENGIKDIKDINDNEFIYDIGPNTIEIFKNIIKDEKLILVNGTMGLSEIKEYENGTKEILKFLNDKSIKTVICGGDTNSAVNKYKLNFYYSSTGGGAALVYLSDEKLIALDI